MGQIVLLLALSNHPQRRHNLANMPYVDDDDADGDLDERELPDPSDTNWDQDTQSCPHCGKDIYDDAEQCPACGRYIGDDSRPRKPIWLIVGVIICAVIVLGWVLSKEW